jgi:lactate dehydrogenase-like 2-hydroxyacid dehydrogenase
MFQKIAVIEPCSLVPWVEEKLKTLAEKTVFYHDIPKDDAEIMQRIGNADCVLVSYTTRISRSVIEHCPDLKYIGMCCSLYSKESANVDIAAAEERGIVVRGIRDYGDRGVVEYILWQLIGILHGFGQTPRYEIPREITGLKVGIAGLGVSGTMIADALRYMGAEVSYYSRTRKPLQEKKGIACLPLDELLKNSEVVFTCLNKNVILLNSDRFAALGNGKILFNTSIGPSAEPEALKAWLENPENLYCCDTHAAIGFDADRTAGNILCMNVSAGRTAQAFELLSRKVLDNLEEFI